MFIGKERGRVTPRYLLLGHEACSKEHGEDKWRNYEHRNQQTRDWKNMNRGIVSCELQWEDQTSASCWRPQRMSNVALHLNCVLWWDFGKYRKFLHGMAGLRFSTAFGRFWAYGISFVKICCWMKHSAFGSSSLDDFALMLAPGCVKTTTGAESTRTCSHWHFTLVCGWKER